MPTCGAPSLAGQRTRVEFALAAEEPSQQETSAAPGRGASAYQRLLEVGRHPLVHRAVELFGAQPVRIDDSPSQE